MYIVLQVQVYHIRIQYVHVVYIIIQYLLTGTCLYIYIIIIIIVVSIVNNQLIPSESPVDVSLTKYVLYVHGGSEKYPIDLVTHYTDVKSL